MRLTSHKNISRGLLNIMHPTCTSLSGRCLTLNNISIVVLSEAYYIHCSCSTIAKYEYFKTIEYNQLSLCHIYLLDISSMIIHSLLCSVITK